MNNNYPSIAILILNWNGRSYLKMCLPSLVALDYPDYELIVIDNGSTDGSLQLLADEYPQINLIAFKENKGFTLAYNAAFQQVNADVIVMLNNDVEVKPDWLHHLVQPFEDPAIGITGSKLLFPDGKTLQHAGAMIEYPLAVARHRFYREVDNGQADERCDVDYVTAASLAVREEVLDEIGYLDADFAPIYYDEVDLCQRAVRAGYRVIYVPESVAIHHESMAMRQMPQNMIYRLQRNRLYYVLKNYNEDQFLQDFLPAERTRFQSATENAQQRIMRRIYLEMVLLLPDIPACCGVERRLTVIQEALLGLAQTAVLPDDSASISSDETFLTQLDLAPFDFPTRAGKFRKAWHSIAGEWDMAHLRQQQTAVNKQLLTWLEKQAQEDAAITEDITFLVQEIAAMQLRFNQMIVAMSAELTQFQTRLDRLEALMAKERGL